MKRKRVRKTYRSRDLWVLLRFDAKALRKDRWAAYIAKNREKIVIARGFAEKIDRALPGFVEHIAQTGHANDPAVIDALARQNGWPK